MHRLPYATTIVSVVIAVALWLAATWLEDESRWSIGESSGEAPISTEQVRPDTPVRAGTDAASCEQAEAKLRASVDSAQYCATDDDCTLFDYGYPIQCMTSVAKEDIGALRAEYSNYERSCEYRVYYDCPTGRMQRHAVCQSNRCTVELRSTEGLEEETLDYLRLERRPRQ